MEYKVIFTGISDLKEKKEDILDGSINCLKLGWRFYENLIIFIVYFIYSLSYISLGRKYGVMG